jgi:hypothetical protein
MMSDLSEHELFSGPEIERACRLPSRSMELLKRHDIIPAPVIAGSRGKADAYDFKALEVFAATSALVATGKGIVASTRIALAVTEELFSSYDEIPWGAGHWRGLKRESIDVVMNSAGRVIPLQLLRRIIADTELNIGKAWDDDYKLVIADGVRAYSMGDQRMSVFHPYAVKPTPLVPEFYILPSPRGEDVTIQRVNGEQDYKSFIDALDFSIGVVQVNFSLAIRRALYEVHDMRRRAAAGAGE